MKFFYNKVRKHLGLFTTSNLIVNGKDLDEVSVLVSKNNQWHDYLDIQFFYGEHKERGGHKYRTYDSLVLELYPEGREIHAIKLDRFLNNYDGYECLIVTEIMCSRDRGNYYVFTKLKGGKSVAEIEYMCEGRSKIVDLDFGVNDERSIIDKLLGKKKIIRM